MLGLLKSKNPYEREAKSVYAALLAHIRKPDFYASCAVPDTFDGRFDLMLLHVFLVMDRINGDGGAVAPAFNQALFDAVFADMDQTLREMGIGDMGIPKHMRRMMKAFNGRMHAYDAAMRDGFLEVALRRNLYGTLPDVLPEALEKMADYMQASANALRQQDGRAIAEGRVAFVDLAHDGETGKRT